MSADNWAICPRCRMRAQKEQAERERRVKEDYGKIPAQDYLNLVDAANNPPQLKYELREDYEFYIDPDNRFSAKYSAKCRTCGWEHSFDHCEFVEVKSV